MYDVLSEPLRKFLKQYADAEDYEAGADALLALLGPHNLDREPMLARMQHTADGIHYDWQGPEHIAECWKDVLAMAEGYLRGDWIDSAWSLSVSYLSYAGNRAVQGQSAFVSRIGGKALVAAPEGQLRVELENTVAACNPRQADEVFLANVRMRLPREIDGTRLVHSSVALDTVPRGL